MHDADARHLYVDVAEPLAERARCVRRAADADERASDGDDAFRAQAPTSAARSIGEAESQLEKRAALRLPRRGRLREPRRGRARPLQPQPGRGAVPRRRSHARSADAPAGALFAEAPLTDGFVSPELRLAVIPFRRLVHRRRAAAPAPARGRLATLRRPAGRRLRRPRGPRDRPLRRLRDQDGRRRHPRLPRARVPRRGQGLRAHRPAREDHPLRRRRRRGAAALGARLEALGRGQGPRPARRPRARRRAAQPLRRAPGAPRATRSRPTASGSSSSSARSPTARPPTSSTRSRRSRPTWSPSARWTG